MENKTFAELIENGQINETDLVDFIRTYHNLVKENILSENTFNETLKTLSIEIKDNNVFCFNNEFEYQFD